MAAEFQAFYKQEGQAPDYTPSADVDAGDVVVIGQMVGVSKLDIAADDLGALATEGEYDVVREADTAFTDGQAAYWDADGDPEQGTAGTGAAVDTSAAGANKFFGYVVGAVADADANLTVRIRKVNVGQASVAANQADSTAADLAALIVDFNLLLDKLKAAGLMVADA